MNSSAYEIEWQIYHPDKKGKKIEKDRKIEIKLYIAWHDLIQIWSSVISADFIGQESAILAGHWWDIKPKNIPPVRDISLRRWKGEGWHTHYWLVHDLRIERWLTVFQFNCESWMATGRTLKHKNALSFRLQFAITLHRYRMLKIVHIKKKKEKNMRVLLCQTFSSLSLDHILFTHGTNASNSVT